MWPRREHIAAECSTFRQGGRRAALTVVSEGMNRGEGHIGRLGGTSPSTGLHSRGVPALRGRGLRTLKGGRLKSGFEVAIDADIDVLIKTGIAFEAGFGLLVGFENTEIMLEEADSPFDANVGIVVLKGMGTALRHFDDFAVGDAGSRPCLGEMVGIELKQSGTLGTMTDNDVFAAFAAFFEVIHGAPEVFDALNRHKIAHSLGINGSGRRELFEGGNRALQSVNNLSF